MANRLCCSGWLVRADGLEPIDGIRLTDTRDQRQSRRCGRPHRARRRLGDGGRKGAGFGA